MTFSPSNAEPDYEAMSDEQLRFVMVSSQVHSAKWRKAKTALKARADRLARGLTGAELKQRDYRNGWVLLAIVVLLVIVLMAVFGS